MMTEKVRESLMEELIQIVKNKGGLKIHELVWELASHLKGDPNRPSDFTVTEMVNELVEHKRLIEIEYSIDFTSVQSFIVPAKTSINIRGQENAPRRI
jgi:hypothetical protein